MRHFLCLLSLAFAQLACAAEAVHVQDAWVRMPPPGAAIAGAYLTLEATQRMTLMHVKSPAAESVELHTMTMHNGVMRMRQLPNIALEAGKPIKLAPGGLHLMLINPKKTLKLGDTVQLDLSFNDSKGKTENVRVLAVVRAPD